MYRKFSADYLFDGFKFLPQNAVLITSALGKVIEITNIENAGDDIQHFNGIISPGFVNAHCHIELSHLKNKIKPQTGLVDFVQQVMANRNAPIFEIEYAMMLAQQELYNSGTIAVGDICNTSNSVKLKSNSPLYWHNFIELSGFVNASAPQKMVDATLILQQFKNNISTLSPHAPYSVSVALFELINKATPHQLVSIHNQECVAENDFFLHKKGNFLNLYKNLGINIDNFLPSQKTSLQTWLPHFNQQQSLILVHNTCTTQADIDFVKNTQQQNQISSLYFCLCVNANKFIEEKAPPIHLLRKNNCAIVIGTDSYASNWELNILSEIKTIQQVTNNEIYTTEILKWSTSNAAKALHIDNIYGSFEKDKTPGIVFVNHLNGDKISPNSESYRIL